MNSFLLPPAPNWYDTGVAACAPDNTFVYASSGDLVVIPPQPTANPKVVYQVHKDRLTCININPEWGNPKKLVVTTGLDKNVNVYDVNAWKTVAWHVAHTTRCDTVVGVTFCGNDHIASVSENGFIILWKIFYDELTCLVDVLTLKDKVTCLSACPHQYGIVAFGYHRGTIVVTNLRKKSVLHILKKHETPIVDLAWCPTTYNVVPKSDLYKSDAMNAKEDEEPDEININLTDVDAVHTEDQSNIAETPLYEKSILESPKEYLLASSALDDFMIIIWNALTNGTIQNELWTTKADDSESSSEYDKLWTALSWVAPSTLLSSSDDYELQQWDFTSDIKSMHQTDMYVHKQHTDSIFSIKAPIKLYDTFSPAVWNAEPLPAVWTLSKDGLILNSTISPTCEVLSAYQTIAGQVNFLTTSKMNKSQLALSASKDKIQHLDLGNLNMKIVKMNELDTGDFKISALMWHPMCENLVSFGTFDGVVGVSDIFHGFEPRKFYQNSSRAPIVALNWGPTDDSEILGLYVVSNEVFMLHLFKSHLNPIILLESVMSVTQLAWKPNLEICAVGDTFGHISFFDKQFKRLTTTYKQCKKIHCLAWHPHATHEDLSVSPYNHWLAACSDTVVIYDLKEIKFGVKKVKVVAEFPGNGGSVLSMDWSPHDNCRLIAVTDVTLITIWDVLRKEVITTIHADQNSTFACVIWSPLHENYVISGGNGNTLRYWQVLEPQPLDKLAHSTCVCAFSGQDHNKSEIILMTKVCKKLCDLRKGCKPPKQTIGIEHVLKARKDLENTTNLEVTSLWEGTIEEEIIKAINSETVTTWHVNMAPSVSQQLWSKTCEAYAKQLTKETTNSGIESSSYFVACNKITEAIDVLCKNNQHYEALALAKLRLNPDDSRITEILEKLAKSSEECGDYDVAAQCYIVMGAAGTAALTKRTNLLRENLEFCVQLAQHGGDEKKFTNQVPVTAKQIKVSPKPSDTMKAEPLLNRVDLEVAQRENKLTAENKDGMELQEKKSDGITIEDRSSGNYVQIENETVIENGDKVEEECDVLKKDGTKSEGNEKEEESDSDKESWTEIEEVKEGNNVKSDIVQQVDTQHTDAKNTQKTDEPCSVS